MKFKNTMCVLAIIKCEEIQNPQSITLQQYIDQYRLSKIRLYVLTKKKSASQIINAIADNSDVSDDESELPDYSSVVQSTPATSSLIGTSEERFLLQQEIESAYNESLRLDQEKDKKSALKEKRYNARNK